MTHALVVRFDLHLRGRAAALLGAVLLALRYPDLSVIIPPGRMAVVGTGAERATLPAVLGQPHGVRRRARNQRARHQRPRPDRRLAHRARDGGQRSPAQRHPHRRDGHPRRQRRPDDARAAVGDTFWVQATAEPSEANALVTIRDRAPTANQWNCAAVEIVASRP